MKKILTMALVLLACSEMAATEIDKNVNIDAEQTIALLGDNQNIFTKAAKDTITKADSVLKKSIQDSVTEANSVANNKMKVFPNPASGTMTIKYDGLDAGSLLLYNERGLELMDLSGLMKENTIKFDIRTGNLIPGAYFIRYNKDNVSIARKIVISH